MFTAHRNANTTIFGLTLIGLFLLYCRFSSFSHSGHMDEYDYLFVGKTLINGLDWPTHSYIFGSDFNWYLYALAERLLGGLSGARTLAAVFGLMSLAGVYVLAHRLWRSTPISILTSFLVSVDAAHLFNSSMATYDIIAFCFFIWSLPLLLMACEEREHKVMYAVFGSIVLSIAILSKYTLALYLPLLAAIAFLRAPKQAIIGSIVITVILSTYVAMHWQQLQILYEVQIVGAHASNARSADIIFRIFRQSGYIMIVALVSLCYLPFAAKREQVLTLLCLLLAIPLAAYHVHGENVISLQKHLVYSNTFFSMVAAWGIHRLTSKLINSNMSTVIPLAILFALAIPNWINVNTMRTSYPDMSSFVSHNSAIAAGGSVLTEDPYLMRYTLFDKIAQSNIKETTWLDNNKDGRREKKDVRQAIWDYKFAYVLLNDQHHPQHNELYRKLLGYRHYTAVVDQEYTLKLMSGAQLTGRLTLHKRPSEMRISATNQH